MMEFGRIMKAGAAIARLMLMVVTVLGLTCPVFAAGGTISGTITDSTTGAGIDGLYVYAYSETQNTFPSATVTTSTGDYAIHQLGAGAYKLKVTGQGYLDQWYSGKGDQNSADMVSVVDSATTGSINFSMVKGASITGVVTDKDTGAGLDGQWVYVYDTAGSCIKVSMTDSSGTYSVTGLASGSYRVQFHGDAGYLGQWYDGKQDLATAIPVTVTAPSETGGINGALRKGASITGMVTDSVSGAPVAGVEVVAYAAANGNWAISATTDSSGVYTVKGLDGNCKVRFSGGGYIEQWYSADGGGVATAVTAVAPNTTNGINVSMVKGGSIAGTVTDSTTGAGIPYLPVYAYVPGSGSYLSYDYTDSTGAYTLSGLSSGSYQVRFDGGDYVAQWYGGGIDQATAATVAVTAPDTTGGIDIALAKGGSITGTVTARETGARLYDVQVVAYDAVTGKDITYGYTNSSGIYTIRQLPSGTYRLKFYGQYAGNFLDQWYSNKSRESLADIVTVAAPATVGNINISMEKGATITGTVTDSTNNTPVAGVAVTIYDASGSAVRYGTTDSTGAYSVTGLASGSYRLSFMASPYAPQWYDGKDYKGSATAVSVTAPATVANINVRLIKGGSITGRLTDKATGAGIAGVYVAAVDRQTGDWGAGVLTADDGTYTITGLTSSSYRLYLSPPHDSGYMTTWYAGTAGLCPGIVAVTAPNATSGVDVQLAKGGSVSGRITDAATGLGIAGAHVSISEKTNVFETTTTSALPGGYASTDTNGNYQITAVASGEYSVTFSAHGYLPAPATVAVNAPSKTTGLDAALVKGGEISGRVTDSATGAGVSGVVVYASADASIATSTVSGSGMTDSNGNYTITGVENGSYSLFFDGREASGSYGSGGVERSAPVSISTHGTVSGIDFTIDQLGSISGRVTDSATGLPLDWTTVSVYDSITGNGVGSAITRADGTYKVGGLPTGSYRVQFGSRISAEDTYVGTWYGKGSASALAVEVAVQSPQNTPGIDAQLAKGGSITGSIVTDGCSFPDNVAINIYSAESGEWLGGTWAYLDNSSAFTIGSLPSGSYKLEIVPSSTGFNRQWYPNRAGINDAAAITVAAGATTGGIRVVLASGGGSISGKVISACSQTASSIRLYDWYSGGLVAVTSPHYSPNYSFTGLPYGTYKLFATVGTISRWYGMTDESADAVLLDVGIGSTLTGIDLTLPCSPDGDFDGSGTVDLLDALKALRVAVGQGTATAENLARGDLAPMINGVSVPDGVIDIADALLILRKVVDGPKFHY